MNKIFRILEITWLVVAIVGVIMSCYFIIMKDTQGAIFFLVFTLIAGVIYSIRKRQRRNYEAKENKK